MQLYASSKLRHKKLTNGKNLALYQKYVEFFFYMKSPLQFISVLKERINGKGK